MGLSYNDIAAEVLARIGNRFDVTARLPIWVNFAYFELLNGPRAEFYELDVEDTGTTTVAATRSYALPSDVWWLRVVEDVTSDFVLRKKTADELDWASLTSGRPIRYARFGASIIIDPTPDGAYNLRLRYRKRPPRLAAGSSPITGDEWDEAIVTLATKKAYEALGEHTKAKEQTQLFEATMSLRESSEELEQGNVEAAIIPRLDY